MLTENKKNEEFISELAPRNGAQRIDVAAKKNLTTEGKKIIFLFRYWKKIMLAIVALIFLAMAGATVFLYHEWKQFKSEKNIASRDEISAITKKIGKYMDLPSDETPTMATVSDREKLKDQPFFTKAQNGDKVLIYTQAQKAILYRPAENKVIEVTNLSAQNLKSPSSENPVSQ
jgi:hypothetical protein